MFLVQVALFLERVQGAGEVVGGEREYVHVRQREGQRERRGGGGVCVCVFVCAF